jgi:Na+/H+-dicarboxylate symporter
MFNDPWVVVFWLGGILVGLLLAGWLFWGVSPLKVFKDIWRELTEW